MYIDPESRKKWRENILVSSLQKYFHVMKYKNLLDNSKKFWLYKKPKLSDYTKLRTWMLEHHLRNSFYRGLTSTIELVQFSKNQSHFKKSLISKSFAGT